MIGSVVLKGKQFYRKTLQFDFVGDATVCGATFDQFSAMSSRTFVRQTKPSALWLSSIRSKSENVVKRKLGACVPSAIVSR